MGKQIQEKPQVQKARRSRKWPWIVGGVLVLILVVLLLIPVILSSGGFTRWVQAKISSSTGGQANIGDLSVGWLRGVQIADFSFRGPNGWAEVDINRITAQPSYSSLLGGTLSVDRAEIDQPHIAVDLRERPPSTKAGPSMDMNDLSRIGDLVVRDGTVQAHQHDRPDDENRRSELGIEHASAGTHVALQRQYGRRPGTRSGRGAAPPGRSRRIRRRAGASGAPREMSPWKSTP